jgi:hypothetical protein
MYCLFYDKYIMYEYVCETILRRVGGGGGWRGSGFSWVQFTSSVSVSARQYRHPPPPSCLAYYMYTSQTGSSKQWLNCETQNNRQLICVCVEERNVGGQQRIKPWQERWIVARAFSFFFLPFVLVMISGALGKNKVNTRYASSFDQTKQSCTVRKIIIILTKFDLWLKTITVC